MDFLASINVDELPEQQTRTMHLVSSNPDFDLSLGFDACCACGVPFTPSSHPVACQVCRRVKYCSTSCRDQDSSWLSSINETNQEGEQETAMGHTSIVCSLLKLCNDDEAVDENPNTKELDVSARETAQDRVRSELESYPATLANVISEGPCYQAILKRQASDGNPLVMHVIGASEDAEFWDAIRSDSLHDVFNAYAEALSELLDTFGIRKIEIYFIGPDCPDSDVNHTTTITSMEDKGTGELLIRSVKAEYSSDILSERAVPEPHIVVFFNPGFTVPEYQWTATLKAIKPGTPFLSTTNTEMEGIADCQYLLDQDKIQSIPPALADVFGVHSPGDDEDDDINGGEASCFFSENPFRGNRVRQSGTLANDLFVKNRWMIGGIMDSFDPSKAQGEESTKKRRMDTENSNKKSGNPALI